MTLTLAFGGLSLTMAAPIDKINAEIDFEELLKSGYIEVGEEWQENVSLVYEIGEKPAVGIPSNSHFDKYADYGFYFVWNPKQKDTGYAVLKDGCTATIVVKSSNEFRFVKLEEPGTYKINQFKQKKTVGEYHNINWIGVEVNKKKDPISLPLR